MPTLNIQGRKVQVDDAFLSMTPEQQNAAVDEIAKSLPGVVGPAADSGAASRAQAGIALAQKMHGMTPEDKRAAAGIDQTTLQPAGIPAYAPMDLGAGGTALTSTMEGVPIAGPLLDRAQTTAAAGLGSLISGQPYSQVHDQMQEMVDESRAAHPNARTAGNVAGAVMGTAPAVLAAPEVFGAGLATTPGLIAAGSTGGLIGATDAAVRSGGDPNEIKKGGLIGMGGGLAGQMVGPLIGRGVKAAADTLKLNSIAKALGLDKKAVGVLADAARQDAIDPVALSLGDDGMLMDLGPNLRHTAGAIAATPGEGKAIVRNAISARDADANWRIRSTLNDTLGEAPTPSRIIDRANRNQLNLQPQYREVLREASDIDAAPIARYLDAEAQTLRGDAQRGIQRVRSMLDYVPTGEEIARARALGQPAPGGLIHDAGTLLNARQAVDDLLETAQGSNHLNALQTARQAIDDELAAKVPNIKEVDAQYAELARQKEAVQRGQSVLSSGREAPRPDELTDEVRQGALPQGLQIGPSAVPLRLREGARAEIERIVGTNANDRVALQRLIKGEGDWNRARLSTLFGQDKANAIIDLLDRERLFADTSNIVTRNSETAARIAAQDAIAGGGSRGFGVREGFIAGGARGAARAAGTKAVERVIDALNNGGNQKAISDMARTLTGGPQQSAVLDALLRAGSGTKIQPKQVEGIARALLLAGPQATR
ncbi:hypothetical protein EOA75_28975 [Mesorhizobium sp. M1A.F.Ca.IN.022.07.1.1]|uniref:hypothetical protein n=1 Tax=Mesorhizobium sp. M1A.F.Ca.IN.022.07.1.1 TaxID=2496767 RepID=UPI000FCB6447|nr:hypothetical protein [Mesorhizobium sp. M1A.F.Ca.IN.022.07.1.1]RUV83810.1 hypothetical protein EOA75_28975 [Mesorhizobium sp. M1A.F.Ca.IN.022.07.1.1]